MLNVIKGILLVVAILSLAGCATISSYQGKELKPNEAIVIIGVQPGNQLWARSEGFTHHFSGFNAPLVITVDTGEFEIQKISNGFLGFNPELKIMNIEPGTINYIGNIYTVYDTVNRQAGLNVVDEEGGVIDFVKKSHPEIFAKYKYQKKIIEEKFSSFGSAKDYANLPIPQPTELDALIVIYGPNDGSSAAWVIEGKKIGDTRVVGLEVNDYTYLRVTPGSYRLIAEIGVFQGQSAQNTVSLSAGEAYFFRLDGGSVFKRIPIPTAVEELKDMDYDPIENPPELK